MRTILSWSGGKDSAWALYKLKTDPTVEVIGLLCVMDAAHRVPMHTTSLNVIRAQAKAAGLPLYEVCLPGDCDEPTYSSIMSATCGNLLNVGVVQVAFGDIFLESVRQYRERALAATALKPCFPLWNIASPRDLALEMVSGGLRAKVCAVNCKKISPDWLGADYDRPFLESLPSDVDWCGEAGDFHTVVYAGPVFSEALHLQKYETNVEGTCSTVNFDLTRT